MITFYGYEKCDTCRKAKQWLTAHRVSFEFVDITRDPPDVEVLSRALGCGYKLSELFNRSGELYRSMNIKEKLPKLSEGEALRLLAGHGKLIKRPVVTDGKKATVGFDEDDFKTWTE